MSMDENMEETGSVSRYQFDKTMMHFNFVNRRCFLSLISVCVTFIFTIIIFVVGYTIRERNWLNALMSLKTPAATEVTDGTQQDGDN